MENKAYSRWLELAADADVSAGLNGMRNRPDLIRDCFYRSLEFGTGGMRGKLGAGTNRMNIYTVRRATRGLAGYLLKSFDKPGVAISYDSRNKSKLFAGETARVLSRCGIAVKIFDRLMPTPALSFAVRQLQCCAGVMITASHNPAIYNGYKVYGPDGCQITEKAAAEIMPLISAADPFDDAYGDFPAAPVDAIPETVIDAYYQAVLAQRTIKNTKADRLSIVYSPLNGSGLEPVTSVLGKAGYTDVQIVPSQREPDGNFPTCPYPNPELPEALSEGLRLCRDTRADILLATDPDCDRVGVAVQDGSDYRILNGNEVGVLLLNYICESRKRTGTMPQEPIAVKTIVTTAMAEKIALQYGVRLVNVLTGFKYIGEIIGKLEKSNKAEDFIFGFEESCGYLSGVHARDKDAVNACLLICDMAGYYAGQGLTLSQQLDLLYESYGYHICALDSFTFEGEHGFRAMQEIMRGFRESPSSQIFGLPVRRRADYSDSGANGGLPPSDVLQYTLEDDTLLTIRPSGTEPKLKVYCQVTRDSKKLAETALADLRLKIKAAVSVR